MLFCNPLSPTFWEVCSPPDGSPTSYVSPPSSNSQRSPFCLHFSTPNSFNKVQRSCWLGAGVSVHTHVLAHTHIKHTPPHTQNTQRCLPMVQCSPFQPWWHWHFPSLQVPCLMQSGLHTRWSQPAPVQPSSQRHAPPIHTPWVPQSTEQTSEGGEKSLGQKQYSWTQEVMLYVDYYLTFCHMCTLTKRGRIL